MVRFKHSTVGINDYYCTILNDNEKVGYCKYRIDNDWSNDIYISFIFINENKRRLGFGTKLVKELKSKYNLLWDYRFTAIGRKWYESLIEFEII